VIASVPNSVTLHSRYRSTRISRKNSLAALANKHFMMFPSDKSSFLEGGYGKTLSSEGPLQPEGNWKARRKEAHDHSKNARRFVLDESMAIIQVTRQPPGYNHINHACVSGADIDANGTFDQLIRHNGGQRVFGGESTETALRYRSVFARWFWCDKPASAGERERALTELKSMLRINEHHGDSPEWERQVQLMRKLATELESFTALRDGKDLHSPDGDSPVEHPSAVPLLKEPQPERR